MILKKRYFKKYKIQFINIMPYLIKKLIRSLNDFKDNQLIINSMLIIFKNFYEIPKLKEILFENKFNNELSVLLNKFDLMDKTDNQDLIEEENILFLLNNK